METYLVVYKYKNNALDSEEENRVIIAKDKDKANIIYNTWLNSLFRDLELYSNCEKYPDLPLEELKKENVLKGYSPTIPIKTYTLTGDIDATVQLYDISKEIEDAGFFSVKF